jgi:hypothetical protein
VETRKYTNNLLRCFDFRILPYLRNSKNFPWFRVEQITSEIHASGCRTQNEHFLQPYFVTTRVVRISCIYIGVTPHLFFVM